MSTRRIGAVDSLRGVAAMAVVLFHYTRRFVELYEPARSPSVSVNYGYLGVNLFFIISGFVIFMTLARTARPMDFVVSRFSRLFPSYWIAIAMTFAITHWLGLPKKLVDLNTAAANLAMLHNLAGVPHVDGVYWTLEVELLFYIGMFALYRCGRLGAIHRALWLMLGLRLLYFVMARAFSIDLPWTLYRLLILNFIPWFALGIAIYALLNASSDAGRREPWITAVAAVLSLAVADGLVMGVLAIGLAAAVHGAASGRLPLLERRALVYLGTISYPLYLLHENIGWSLQLRLLAAGLPFDATVVLALVAAIALATALHYTVEQPAMDWIRSRYRQRLARRLN
ncbi:MAG: acyltransferase [Burkholderiales bacterium]|nr:acyltransferase [Burkholderiales bacterium]